MEEDNQGDVGCPPSLLKFFKYEEDKKAYRCRYLRSTKLESKLILRLCLESDSSSRRGRIAETSSRSNFHRHLRDCHREIILTEQQKNEKFGELVATAFATNLIPFAVADTKEFQDVVKFLDDTVKIPSRRSISTNYLPKVMEKKLYTIIAAAQGAPVCITTDGWSHGTGGVYLVSITIHYIDANGIYREAVLATKPMEGSHDAASMAHIIEAEISSADLDVHCAVTDGASVMPAMCRLLGYDNLWCVVHVLQLAVRTLDADPTVKELFDKMNRLAGNLHRSSTNRQKLGVCLMKNGVKKPKGIPRSCPTRWNSDVLQLQRVFDYIDSINELIRDGVKFGITEFTQEEKKLNKILQLILQYPFSATAQLCSSSSCISDALVIMLCLRKRVVYMSEEDASSTVRKYCSIFRTDLESRMEDTVLKDWMYKAAIFIDPRYSLLDGLYSKDKKVNAEWWNEVENEFVANMEPADDDGSDAASMISSMSIDDRNTAASTSSSPPRRLDRSTFTGSLMDDILPRSTTSRSLHKKSGSFQDEIAEYKRIVMRETRATGPTAHLEFWKGYSKTLPTLAAIARKLLSIPASSVLSERTFSRATALYRNKNRANLEKLKAEMCILMGANREDGDIRKRNVKRIAVKPLMSLGDYSSDEECAALTSDDEESDEEEEELLKESLKTAKNNAKQRQAEIEADAAANVSTSKSKRCRSASKKSTKEAKKSRK